MYSFALAALVYWYIGVVVVDSIGRIAVVMDPKVSVQTGRGNTIGYLFFGFMGATVWPMMLVIFVLADCSREIIKLVCPFKGRA